MFQFDRAKLIDAIIKELKTSQPEAIRRILSGYTDTNLIAYAWNVGVNVDQVLGQAVAA